MNTEWKGPQDGLPPVGTPVTIVNPDCYSIEYGHHLVGTREVVTVVANYTSFDGVECTVVEHNGGGYVFRSSMIRPIQSERDKAIEAMYADFDMISCNTGHVKVSDLYDAGYRKPMSREDAEKILCSIARDLKNGDLRFSVRQIILNELGYKD